MLGARALIRLSLCTQARRRHGEKDAIFVYRKMLRSALAVQPQFILVITSMDNVALPTEPSPREPSRHFDFRLAAGAILLLPVIWFTWLTIDGLSARRQLRTDLAELTHVRYGLLSADRWRDIIAPILNAQIDKLDLKGQSKNLRPMVQQSLYALLENIKKQMSAPSPKGSAMPGQGNPMLVNLIIASLRPHVPEYTNVVMAELAKPKNQTGFKESIRSVLAEGITNTFGTVDMTTYSSILKRYGCPSGAVCEQTLEKQIEEADERITRYYLTVLGSVAAGFALLAVGKPVLSRSAVVVLMLFCIVLLAGGVLSPMIEVEARITRLDVTLLGAPIEFREQSLYFRSKNVLEVFQTLIEMGRPEMTVVAVLVLLFSVVFPLLKMLALSACLLRPAMLRTSRIVKFLAFESSKWSMADVMALAIFMSFVAFNGLIGSAMEGLKDAGGQLAIPTNSSKMLPGYYLFIGFCLASIFLSKKLERGIASSPASDTVPSHL